jgi:hypothetical protein
MGDSSMNDENAHVFSSRAEALFTAKTDLDEHAVSSG